MKGQAPWLEFRKKWRTGGNEGDVWEAFERASHDAAAVIRAAVEAS